MKKFLALSLAAGLLLALVAVAAAPRWVESRYNRVLRRPPYPASARAVHLHRELTVADLHADSLLWSRDLLRRSERGHVDIPRLAEANVALQMFTVVTKIPRGLSLQRNRADSDMITALAVSEGWPPATWRYRHALRYFRPAPDHRRFASARI